MQKPAQVIESALELAAVDAEPGLHSEESKIVRPRRLEAVTILAEQRVLGTVAALPALLVGFLELSHWVICRITSYNVCYTKLLRNDWHRECARMPSPGFRRSRKESSGSFQSHPGKLNTRNRLLSLIRFSTSSFS